MSSMAMAGKDEAATGLQPAYGAGIEIGPRVAYPHFRDFIKVLEEHNEIVTIDVPFDVSRENTELDALTRHLQNTDGPAVILTNLESYNTPDVPVIINLFGSRKRVALALGETTPRAAGWKNITSRGDEPWPWPVVLDHKDVPCKEVIIHGDDIDLRRDFPKVWFQGERQVYITTGLSFTRDPENRGDNMGWYRYGLLDLDPDGNPYPEEIQAAPHDRLRVVEPADHRHRAPLLQGRTARRASRGRDRLPERPGPLDRGRNDDSDRPLRGCLRRRAARGGRRDGQVRDRRPRGARLLRVGARGRDPAGPRAARRPARPTTWVTTTPSSRCR